MIEKSCQTCRHFESFEDPDVWAMDGECRRYPPTIQAEHARARAQVNDGTGYYQEHPKYWTRGLWPGVGFGHWCGEWKERDS